jgi:hypothetical protein
MNDIITLVRSRLKQKTTDQDWLQKRGFWQRRIGKRASPSQLAADEERLGFALPPMLKRLYVEIGNGGFGPGYGLIGISGGVPDDLGRTATEAYRGLRSQERSPPGWSWPEALLPICHWGCGITSCVDCSTPDFRMRIFDPNLVDDDNWRDGFFAEADSFEDWIRAWAEGADLWDRMYGEAGYIRGILLEREGTSPPHAVQVVLHSALSKKRND